MLVLFLLYCSITFLLTTQCISGVSQVFPLCAVDEVLCQFRQQFIEDTDAKQIVSDLKHKRIISDAVLTEVNREAGRKRQNEILYDYLEKSSTRDSLTTVCDAMISVSGHPKMKQLGEDMKNRLLGKWVYVCMCVHSTLMGMVG